MRPESKSIQAKSVRDAVFDHYGRQCVCCGIGAEGRLGIDHIYGDGKEHQGGRSFKSSGEFWTWLWASGFPDEFQTLCRGCNASKGRGPACALDHGNGPTTHQMHAPLEFARRIIAGHPETRLADALHGGGVNG